MNAAETPPGKAINSLLVFQTMMAVTMFTALSFSGKGVIDLAVLLKVLLGICAAVVAGRFVLNQVFRLISPSGSSEIIIGTALLVVVGSVLLMRQSGTSGAIGAFLAGAFLANSNFRHQIEDGIEPFKNLMLGLYFLTFGASLDLRVVYEELLIILGGTLGLLTLKALILYCLARFTGLKPRDVFVFVLVLIPSSEFAIALLGVGYSIRLFDLGVARTLKSHYGAFIFADANFFIGDREKNKK
jgi:glutathione-regulated potassium-efflux system protein KefB